MGGVSQQLGGCAQLQQAPLLEHRDPLRQRAGLFERVGHHQRGELEVPEVLLERYADLEACYRVHRPEWLVEQEDPGLAAQRTRERDPLTLSAG